MKIFKKKQSAGSWYYWSFGEFHKNNPYDFIDFRGDLFNYYRENCLYVVVFFSIFFTTRMAREKEMPWHPSSLKQKELEEGEKL